MGCRAFSVMVKQIQEIASALGEKSKKLSSDDRVGMCYTNPRQNTGLRIGSKEGLDLNCW